MSATRIALRAMSVVAFGTGLVAILGPVALQLDTFGITGQSMTLIAVTTLSLVVRDSGLVSEWRVGRTRALNYRLAGIAVAAVVGGALVTVLEDRLVVHLHLVTALVLAAVGVGSALDSSQRDGPATGAAT